MGKRKSKKTFPAPSSDRLPDQRERELPDPRGEEFAYLVATHAWQDGLTANAISQKLFGDSVPRHLMQVKRALKRAQGAFLVLRPPNSTEWSSRLNEALDAAGRASPIRFHVVDGPSAGVFVRSAELIRDHILQLGWRHRGDEESVVVCNAGGRAVSETVRVMRRNPPVPPGTEEDQQQLRKALLFVAANAAYQPTVFHRSSNFLSVSMAEMFEANHFALPREEDQTLAQHHRTLVARTSLFICGAGACEDDSGLMTTYFKKMGWGFPEHAVGDLAFNLLDDNGDEVALRDKGPLDFMAKLNPSLTLSSLMHIAQNARVFLILDAEEPRKKRRIGAAVLRRNYVTDIVLGAAMAEEVYKEFQGER